MAGYAGDGNSGTWSSNNAAYSTVITGDGTAYHGSNVMRLVGGNSGNDEGDGGGQLIATKTLAQPYDVAQGPTTISWAVRRLQLKDTPANNDAGVIFELFFTDGSTVSEEIELNDILYGLALDTWYEFTVDLNITGDQMSINYHAVNATDSNDVFINNANWTTGLASSEHTNLSRIDFRTWSGNEYAHEIDAVALVPEPASLALLGLGGLLMLGRRSHRH